MGKEAVTDEYSGSIAVKVDKAQIKELSQVRPFRGILQVVFEWTMIAIAIWASEAFWSPVAYICAVIFIGTRMHAIAVLMHDATHYRLLAAKKWNDFVGEVFLAWPIFITLHAYRKNHFAHHHYTNTDKDPDWVRRAKDAEHAFPMSRKKLYTICLKYLFGLYAVDEIKKASKLKSELPQRIRYGRIGFYIISAAAITYFHVWDGVLLYWIVPFFTSFMLALYIRGVAEHFGSMDYKSILTGSRHTNASWLERILISPNNVNYHLDHHLYPAVPFYNLPQLHRLLLQESVYKRNAHITDGYFSGLVRECTAVQA